MIDLPKRSLEELDTVIEEIIERNPEWYEELITFIKAQEFAQR